MCYYLSIYYSPLRKPYCGERVITITFPLCFYKVSKSKDYFLMSSFNQLFSLPSPIQSKNIPVALFQKHLYSKSFHLQSMLPSQMGHSKFKEEWAGKCARGENSQNIATEPNEQKDAKKKKKHCKC